MVNTVEDDEHFTPDDVYFPKIAFFDSRARLLRDVHGIAVDHPFFYHDPADIAQAMRKAIKMNYSKNVVASKNKQKSESRKKPDTDSTRPDPDTTKARAKAEL